MSTSNQSTSIISSSGDTNTPPSSSDQATLTRYLSSLDRNIDSLNKEIAALTVRRDAIVTDRTHCARILNPLRRFPDELLFEIFDYIRCQGRAVAVHRLARVCSSWRTIILSSPTFWRNVELSVDRLTAGQTFTVASFLQRLTSHIQRSQDLPMALTVDRLDRADIDVLTEHIFSSVKAHWSSISLYANDVHTLHRVIDYYKNFPTEVEYLSHASFTGSHQIEGVSQLVEEGRALDFTIFTKLRSFRMDTSGFIASRVAFQVNWKSLLHLHLCSASTSKDYIQHILCHCPQLESLFVTPNPFTGNSAKGLSLTLERLRKLTIKAGGPSMPAVPSLLLALSAPRLEDLQLEFPAYFDDRTGVIVDFIERHQGNLQTFRCSASVLLIILYDSDRRENKVKPIQFLSRITTLHVNRQIDDIDSSTYSGLAFYGIKHLPNLRRIEFDGHTMDNDRERRDVAALLAEFEKMGEDKKVVFHRRVYERPVREGLDRFREKGMLVVEETVYYPRVQ